MLDSSVFFKSNENEIGTLLAVIMTFTIKSFAPCINYSVIYDIVICSRYNFVSISHQGYGFIDFVEKEDAEAALAALKLQGKNVSINYSYLHINEATR